MNQNSLSATLDALVEQRNQFLKNAMEARDIRDLIDIRILQCIKDHPDSRLNHVSAVLGIQTRRISQHLNSAVLNKFVTQSECPQDRRFTYLNLTVPGRNLVQYYEQSIENWENDVKASLGEEKYTLLQSLIEESCGLIIPFLQKN